MKNSRSLSPWGQTGFWGQGTALRLDHSASGPATATESTDLIADVCASFARMLNWKSAVWVEHPARRFVLTENHELKPGGCHIELKASPAADELWIRGGFYDKYLRPIVVSDQCVPLSWVDRQRLAGLLTETLGR